MNVTISREGLESLQNGGKARTYEGVVKQKESIMQASKSLGAGYGYRLSEEAGKLKGQRESGGAWSVSVVPAVNGASCVHLPFALARAGKFYPSITYYARKGKTGNVFEKILKKFSKDIKMPGCGLYSVGCALGSFFRGWVADFPAVAFVIMGGKILSVACPFPVKMLQAQYHVSISFVSRLH